MIRIIFFSDTHLGFDYPIHPRVDKLRRGGDFFDRFLKVLAYAEQTKPHLVIHGGDLFFRSKISPVIRDKAYGIISSFVDRTKIPFIIVPGNHERSNLPESIFLHQPDLYIFRGPVLFDFIINNQKIKILGFPFIRNNVNDVFRKIIQRYLVSKPEELNLLVMHQAIEGATVGPGNYIFKPGHDVLAINHIPDIFSAVLCGHIHRQQVILKQGSNGVFTPIIHAGSTERTSFAEKDEKKGFFDLSFSWNVQKSRWDILYNFVELKSRPMIEIVLTDTSQFSESWIRKKISELPFGSIVKFKYPKKLKQDIKISDQIARWLKNYRDQFIFYDRNLFRQNLFGSE
ncbi:MAG: hypothetical protein Kow00108_00200 [Calditrichia bacterium]